MLKKQVLLSLILLLSLSMFLTACAPDREADSSESGNTNNGDGTTAEEPKKPEQLELWVNDEEAQIEAWKEITERYTAETGINVKLTKVSQAEQAQKLAIAGPEGNGPDLFWQPHDRIGDLVIQGLAAPLDDPELGLSDEVLNSFSDAAINAVTFNYEEPFDQNGATDHIYGMPVVIETYALYYNTDLVDEAPQTMDELKSTAAELTNAADDEYGFLFEAKNFYFTFPFFSNYGGYIFGGELNNDTSDIGLATDGAVQGLTYLQSFFDEGLIPQSITPDVMNGLFQDGKVGMVLSGPWSIPDYTKALGDKLATAPIPTINGEGAQSFVGVKSWMLSYYSENKYWAADLASFLTNEESLSTYFEVAGELPPRDDVLEKLADPIYDGFVEQIQHGIPMPNVPEMSQVWEPMNNAHEFIAEGQDVQGVLQGAQEQVENQIKATGQ